MGAQNQLYPQEKKTKLFPKVPSIEKAGSPTEAAKMFYTAAVLIYHSLLWRSYITAQELTTVTS